MKGNSRLLQGNMVRTSFSFNSDGSVTFVSQGTRFPGVLEGRDFSPCFEGMMVSALEKVSKPDPRIFDLTLNRLGVKKDEAILIDDRIVNIEGAQKYGLSTVYFKSKDQALADLHLLLGNQNKQ